MAVSLQSYIVGNGINFLITIFFTSMTFGLIYKDISIVLSKKVLVKNVVLAGILSAVLFHLPQFVVDWLFYYPDLFNKVADSFLLYPNPLLIFPYYWILRHIMKHSVGDALRGVSEMMTAQYITMVLFQVFSGVWAYVFASHSNFPRLFDTDLLAMLSTGVAAWLFMLVMKVHAKKKGGNVELPYNFPLPKPTGELFRVLGRVTINYGMLVIFGILMIDQRHTEIRFENFAMYTMLVVVLGMYMRDSVRKRTMNILKWEEAETSRYIQSLVVANEEFRAVKHDFYGMLQVYSGYIAGEDLEGLKRYHSEMVATTTRVGNAFGLIEALRPRMALCTLINVKSGMAHQMGVRLDIVGSGVLVDVAMNDLDLCRMLGNLLENAIEGAAESEGRLVEVSCRKGDGGRVEVRICNSTKEMVDLERIFRLGYTTREHRSGEGLITVKGILALYGDCSMMVDVGNKEIAFFLMLRGKKSASGENQIPA